MGTRISVVAVGTGLLLDHLAMFITVELVGSGLLLLTGGGDAIRAPSTSGLLALLLLGALCSVFGGYAAGRIAGESELIHAGLLGLGDVLIGAGSLFFVESPPAFWYTTLAFLCAIPAALLGGQLAKLVRPAAA